MSKSADFQIFVDVLLSEYSSTRWRVLAGEMIAAYGEVNHTLASLKGEIDRSRWLSHADHLDHAYELYRQAWLDFTHHVQGREPMPPPDVRDANAAFVLAVEEMQQLRQALRGELDALSLPVWRT